MKSLGVILAKRIRETRENTGKSQDWLAKEADLSRATINKWEKHGAGSASLNETERLCAALKLTPAEAFGWASPSQPIMAQVEKSDSLLRQVLGRLPSLNEDELGDILQMITDAKRGRAKASAFVPKTPKKINENC